MKWLFIWNHHFLQMKDLIPSIEVDHSIPLLLFSIFIHYFLSQLLPLMFSLYSLYFLTLLSPSTISPVSHSTFISIFCLFPHSILSLYFSLHFHLDFLTLLSHYLHFCTLLFSLHFYPHFLFLHSLSTSSLYFLC